jgi:hypothetical protein
MIKEGYRCKIPVQTIFTELDEEGKIILDPETITDT